MRAPGPFPAACDEACVRRPRLQRTVHSRHAARGWTGFLRCFADRMRFVRPLTSVSSRTFAFSGNQPRVHSRNCRVFPAACFQLLPAAHVSSAATNRFLHDADPGCAHRLRPPSGRPPMRDGGMALWGPCVSRNQLVVPAGLRKRSTCPSQRAFGVTRQITLPTSSATSSAPRLSDATPTGRPCALPSASRNPSSTVIGGPLGLPSANGTNNTL